MLIVNKRMAVSTGVIDGYIISNWTEEALADMLDQTTLKDNPLGFTDLTPIGVDGVAAGLEDRHVEFLVGEQLYTESVNRAVEMGGMDGGLPKMEGVNVWLKLQSRVKFGTMRGVKKNNNYVCNYSVCATALLPARKSCVLQPPLLFFMLQNEQQSSHEMKVIGTNF